MRGGGVALQFHEIKTNEWAYEHVDSPYKFDGPMRVKLIRTNGWIKQKRNEARRPSSCRRVSYGLWGLIFSTYENRCWCSSMRLRNSSFFRHKLISLILRYLYPEHPVRAAFETAQSISVAIHNWSNSRPLLPGWDVAQLLTNGANLWCLFIAISFHIISMLFILSAIMRLSVLLGRDHLEQIAFGKSID